MTAGRDHVDWTRRLRRGGAWLVLALFAAIWLVPVVSAVEVSFAGAGFRNYVTVLSFRYNGLFLLPLSLMNSLLVSGVSVTLMLAVCLAAAFGISKLRFKGSVSVYSLITAFFAVPIVTTLFPNTLILKYLGLLNTYFAMILPMVAINIPTTLIILKNFVDGIPDSIIEAAQVDGTPNITILTRIIAPMANAGLVNAAIVAGFLTWNDFATPQIFITRATLFPLTLLPGFFTLTLGKGVFGPLFASVILIAVPSLAFYAAMRGRIVEGLASGAVKG